MQKLLKFGLKPIVVLDGKRLQIKEKTYLKRSGQTELPKIRSNVYTKILEVSLILSI
jgi:hypothetical protein